MRPIRKYLDAERPARMIVSSLKNRANGGAPVMATAPASYRRLSVGSRSSKWRMPRMRFVRHVRMTTPAPKNIADLLSE